MCDVPTSKPRISPSAKSAGPSRIRIRLISTFALFRGAGAYAKSSGASSPGVLPDRLGEERADKAIYVTRNDPFRPSGRGPRPTRHFVAPSTQGGERISLPRL